MFAKTINKKLRVLFISGELIAGDVAYRLKQEGCEVKLFIEDISRKDCFDGMIKKTNNWKKELAWVGKSGLIVFDDVGYGQVQEELRKKGYNVFGANLEGEKLEKNREYAQRIFFKCGMDVQRSKDFKNAESAIKYIKNNRAVWVVKQNGHEGSLSYVGCLKNGEDAISFLHSLKKFRGESFRIISLQKKVEGVEIAVARYFNGTEWTSPIFISFEHKPLLDGNRGPLTAEMGTLAWYDPNENNKFFLATLNKLKPYLTEINYKGYVDINSIVNGKKLFPIEATMRFGSPTNQLQGEMHLSSWKDLLYCSATGRRFNLKYKKGYSIVVSIAIPPFPYKAISSDYYLKGMQILFKNKLTKEENARIHYEEVSMKNGNLFIAGSNGYILFITGNGKTVDNAKKKAYSIINKIVIPRMIYRTDIGSSYEKEWALFKKWGWI